MGTTEWPPAGAPSPLTSGRAPVAPRLLPHTYPRTPHAETALRTPELLSALPHERSHSCSRLPACLTAMTVEPARWTTSPSTFRAECSACSAPTAPASP